MMIYFPQKLQKALTFFKLSPGWQMLRRRLALKQSRTDFPTCGITEQTGKDQDDIVDEELMHSQIQNVT